MMYHYLSTVWNDIFVPGVPLLEKTIRTLVVYGAVLLGLRLAGKRELSQLNPFDLVVLLLLSNTVQNAIIGNDNSVIGGLFGAAVLLLTNHFLVRYLFTSRRVGVRWKSHARSTQRGADNRCGAGGSRPPAGNQVDGGCRGMQAGDGRG